MKVAIFVSLGRTLFAIAGMLLPSATPASGQSPTAEAREEESADAAALMALERQVEAAYLHADTAFLRAPLREDFRFSHGGGTVAGKDDTLANFAKAGNFVSRTLTSVEVEVHENVALTSGRIEIRSTRPAEYTICYVRPLRTPQRSLAARVPPNVSPGKRVHGDVLSPLKSGFERGPIKRCGVPVVSLSAGGERQVLRTLDTPKRKGDTTGSGEENHGFRVHCGHRTGW